MATRARIGIQKEDGTIIAAYQQWDGYPGGLGYNLEDHWTDPTKVTEAIMLGDASKWGIIIGEKTDFVVGSHGIEFPKISERDRIGKKSENV